MQVVPTGRLATLAVVLPAGGPSFSAVLGPSHFAQNEWILIVGAPNTPGMLDWLRGERPESYTELARVCAKIHAVLASVVNVSNERWYFEGPRSQSAAVSTPDELPWPQRSR